MAARSLNQVMIIGNMTRDPELRYTANGTPVVSFGVATNREYTPSHSEEAVEETEFHNIVAWSKLAELCDRLLRKGQKVFIRGRLQTRNWVDEGSGKKMYRTETVADEMIVLSPPKDGASHSGDQGSATDARPATDPATGGSNNAGEGSSASPVNKPADTVTQSSSVADSSDTDGGEIPF